MSNYFGSRSKEHLESAHENLQKVANRVILVMDHSVTCGHRNQEDQDGLDPRFTQLKWPHSHHNREPAEAIDVAPYPIHWDDIPRFCVLAGMYIAIGHELGIPLGWGGWWRSKDYPHIYMLGTQEAV